MMSSLLKRLLFLVPLLILPSFARAQGGQYTLIKSSPEPLPACLPAAQGQLQPQIWDVTAQQMKTCTAPNVWSNMGGASNYQNLYVNGTIQDPFPGINLIAGTNITIICVDGAVRNDCTFTSSNTAATAWSAITNGLNANSGTFSASGNAWDFSLATSFKMPTAGFIVPGSVSGTTTFLPPSAGTFNINIPALGGTLAVAGNSPIVLSPSGIISCPTCNTSGASVTSVGLSQTGSVFTFSNNPVTSAGNINIAFASESANTFLAAPNGSAGAPAFRTIVLGDIPAINLAAGAVNGGVTGVLPQANLPLTVVYNNQSNTYSAAAATQDFSQVTTFKVPIIPGATPTLSGTIAFDSTANRFEVGIAGTNFVLPWVAPGAPVNTNCVIWVGTGGQQGAQTCGGGGTPGGLNDSIQYNNGGVFAGLPSPTTNGFYFTGFNVVGSAAVPPNTFLGGVPVDATNPGTLLFSDRSNYLRWTSGSTLTLPAASGQFASNLHLTVLNTSGGNLAVTPTTPNNINGGTAQAPATLPNNYLGILYQDQTPNWWMVAVPTQAAIASPSVLSPFVIDARFCGGMRSEGLVGNPGWFTDLPSPSTLTQSLAPDANHPCSLVFNTGTTSSNYAGTFMSYCNLGTTGTACTGAPTANTMPLLTTVLFDSYWVFKNGASVTSISMCAGFNEIAVNTASICTGANPPYAIEVIYDTNGGDTHWNAVTGDATGGGGIHNTRVDLGVTPVAGHWTCAHIFSTVIGVISFQVGDDATSACSHLSSVSTISTTLPPAGSTPVAYAQTYNTTAKSTALNRFIFSENVNP